MMKKGILITVCFFALFTCTSAFAVPTISIDSVKANPGDTGLVVNVNLNNEAPALSAVSISIDFDKNALTYRSGSGKIEMGTWEQTSVSLASAPHASNTLGGQLDISALNYAEAIPANTGGIFATFIFDIPATAVRAVYPLKVMITTPPITEALDVDLARIAMTWIDGEVDLTSQGTTTTTTTTTSSSTSTSTTTTSTSTSTSSSSTSTTSTSTTTSTTTTSTTIPGEMHSADTDKDNKISLSELLRVVQLYNQKAAGYHCGVATVEDGFALGDGDRNSCTKHDADTDATAFVISMEELLSVIQLYNFSCYEFVDGQFKNCTA